MLDDLSNPALKIKFDRLDRSKIGETGYVYLGQMDQKNRMSGIGTVLYNNGFCYQGMWVKG
jgi:hypothetical protein